MPYCTRSKALALERWSRQFNPERFLWVWGQRAEESAARAALPEYEREQNFKHYVWRPVHKWTKQRLTEYIASKGQKVNPVYEKGISRGGNCKFCIHAKKAEMRLAVTLWPEQAKKYVETIEVTEDLKRRDYSVQQAIQEAELEKEQPDMFLKEREYEDGIPRAVCGVNDPSGFGCDG